VPKPLSYGEFAFFTINSLFSTLTVKTIMDPNFTFPRRPRPAPARRPVTDPHAGSAKTNRESNALRASVLDAALLLGVGTNSTVTNWIFNNTTQEEDEDEVEVEVSVLCSTYHSYIHSSPGSHFSRSLPRPVSPLRLRQPPKSLLRPPQHLLALAPITIFIIPVLIAHRLPSSQTHRRNTSLTRLTCLSLPRTSLPTSPPSDHLPSITTRPSSPLHTRKSILASSGSDVLMGTRVTAHL
jgi:hypothetical protein